jgi:hypothetical protein
LLCPDKILLFPSLLPLRDNGTGYFIVSPSNNTSLRHHHGSRSLQILSWSLQLNIGARDVIKGRESYEEVTDFVMECLQQPCADLRGGYFVHCTLKFNVIHDSPIKFL